MTNIVNPAKLEDLQRLLQSQLRGRIWEIRVVQREGHVVLQGFAISYYAKQLAQHLAFHALDRTALVNEINVSAPAAGPSDPETAE